MMVGLLVEFYGTTTWVGYFMPSTTTPGHSRHGGDGYEEVICIPQFSSITEASLPDWFYSV